MIFFHKHAGFLRSLPVPSESRSAKKIDDTNVTKIKKIIRLLFGEKKKCRGDALNKFSFFYHIFQNEIIRLL